MLCVLMHCQIEQGENSAPSRYGNVDVDMISKHKSEVEVVDLYVLLLCHHCMSLVVSCRHLFWMSTLNFILIGTTQDSCRKLEHEDIQISDHDGTR